MKKLIILFLITTSFSYAQKNFLDQNYIEVTGTIESEIIPDEIYLSITINENDKKGKESVEIQESKMIQLLKSAGINTDKNLSVENFNSSFSTFFLRKDDVLKIKQYTLLVHNTEALTKAFKIFDTLEISNVYISKVDHSNIENLKLEAKIKAIQIAKKKAKAYAEAIDQNIGKAILITEKSINVSNALAGAANGIVIRGNSSIYGNRANDMLNSLDFKKITLAASIEATFELL